MWPWKRTPKPSETSLLCLTITKLAAELQAQSESHRKLSEKLLTLAEEKDKQIKLVLESRFEERVEMWPPRVTPPQILDNPEHLSDVSEMSESETEKEMEKVTARQREADSALEASLKEELADIAREHAEAHDFSVGI